MDIFAFSFRYFLMNPIQSETVDVELTAHLDFFIIGALLVCLNRTSILLLSELPAISLVGFVASSGLLPDGGDSTFGLSGGPSVLIESGFVSVSPINDKDII